MKVSVKDIKYDYGNFIVKGPLSYSLPALGIPVSDLSLEVLTEMQKSYNTFSHNWTISSVKNLCNSIIADSDAEAGMVYYGKFTGEGLPGSLGLAEMTVEIIADDNSNGKSLVLTVFSADTAPYKWEAQYVKINGNYPSSVTWRAYQQQITSSNKLSASLVSGLPTVPTKVSQLTNDVPYLTEDDLKVEDIYANGHEYVDLGLPSGTLWATMNIGASNAQGGGNTYNPTDTVDVESLWGGGWHVPTEEQWLELLNNTDYRWNNGYFNITSRINGNGITLYARSQNYDSYTYYRASSGKALKIGSNGVNTLFSNTPGRVRPILKPSSVDKYATKLELNAETQRAQAVEATIPNVAVVNLETEDIDTSTNPITITNQDKISLICDLIDAGTFVICNLQGGPFPAFGFWFLVPILNGTTGLNNVSLFATNLTVNPSEYPPSGLLYVAAYADVTSRYVTSNTEP